MFVSCGCRVLSLRRANHSSTEFLQSVLCLSVTRCNSNPLHLQTIGRSGENKKEIKKRNKQRNKNSQKRYCATFSIINVDQVLVK
jgi:hypothetical protein